MHHALQNYIEGSWAILRRSPLDAMPDPKVDEKRMFLYIPKCEKIDEIKKRIGERKKHTNDQTPIEVRTIPDDPRDIREHGLLYLPNDYVVPGGRFNEMYGWDSYWIILGLLHSGRLEFAKGMAENAFYQIENYGGKILNANRTYYLSRSQPPILGPAVLAVAARLEGPERLSFLTRAEAALSVNYTQFWKAQRYTEDTGLFRYGHPDQGMLGPCPEVVFGERDDKGESHYEIIASYLRNLPAGDHARERFYDEKANALTPEAFAGDRGVRESGFDPSMHMGFYGLETPDFNPVCLNTLLYVQCRNLARINRELRRPGSEELWDQEADRLRTRIRKYLWNDGKKLFTDYNRRKGAPSGFPFLTAAYPLWAGIATPEQAACFHKNLGLFEAPYGIMATSIKTGCQWDAPYMWAPLVYFTVIGLKNYGYDAAAERIAGLFTDTVTRVFNEYGSIYEKFDAQTGTHQIQDVMVSYRENVAGFGWTNGIVLDLERRILPAARAAARRYPDWMRFLAKSMGLNIHEETEIRPALL